MRAGRRRRRTSACRAVRAVWSRRLALCQIGTAVGGVENSRRPKRVRIGCGALCCVCSTPATLLSCVDWTRLGPRRGCPTLGRPAAPCGTARDQSGSESDGGGCAGFVPAGSAGTTWGAGAVSSWDAPPPRAEQRGTKAGPNRMVADVPASFLSVSDGVQGPGVPVPCRDAPPPRAEQRAIKAGPNRMVADVPASFHRRSAPTGDRAPPGRVPGLTLEPMSAEARP